MYICEAQRYGTKAADLGEKRGWAAPWLEKRKHSIYFPSANDCRVAGCVPACGGVPEYIFLRTFIFPSSGLETKLGIPGVVLRDNVFLVLLLLPPGLSESSFGVI